MSKAYKILAINPGSTSTKIGVYEHEAEMYRKNIQHSAEELIEFKIATDQSEFRKKGILAFLSEIEFDVRDLDAIVARGGGLPPLQPGAYRINKRMVDFLRDRPSTDHASNVAAVIAYEISSQLGIPSYIYDGISVDQMTDFARISGVPELPRISIAHILNPKAMARKYAMSIDKEYADLTLIIAHLGGGITLSIHHQGRIVDVISDDEGPFSPERAGKVQSVSLVDLCYSGEYDHQALRKLFRGKGGLIAYLGTNSAIDVEKRIAEGDHKALLVYEAMAYQVAKGIGELSTVVQGRIDAIILTGGIAHSAMLTRWITERVEFIAPVAILPGENELEAMAFGILRVLRGEETAREYDL